MALNVNDLYEALEVKRKLRISCPTQQDFFSLRASIYRARKTYLEAFAMIDDTSDEDGYQLTVRWEKEGENPTAFLELTTKEPKRQWEIVEMPDG